MCINFPYYCNTIYLTSIGCYIVLSCTEINTSHHNVANLLFRGGDLLSLITFEWTILYQAVSCFSGRNLTLAFQSVMYLYFRNVRGRYEWKNERKWCSWQTIIFDRCV